MKRISLIALLIVVLAGGCGDKRPQDPAAKGLTPEQAIKQAEQATGTSLSTTTTLPGQTRPSTTTAGKANSQGGATTTTAAPDPSVKMSLERDCVRRGVDGDSQVLVVTTSPEDTVAWSTEYSDGSNELQKPEYKTGSGYGKADDKGHFRTEWKIPNTAPVGTATLHTIAKGKFGPTLTFRVVEENGRC